MAPMCKNSTPSLNQIYRRNNFIFISDIALSHKTNIVQNVREKKA